MPSLSPQEKAFRLRFDGSDCLYRDHHGRRVIVDVEGLGAVGVESRGPRIVLVRGEEEVKEFEESFTNGSIVLAEDSGTVIASVTLGRQALVEGTRQVFKGRFDGAGWVIGASAPFIVDERREYAPEPSPNFAVPFFRSIEGDGEWTVILDDSLQCELTDRFGIDDPAALQARSFTVQNISAIFPLSSTFADETPFEGMVASHLNAAVFRCAIPPDNRGLILRKLYDRFHGRQRARVFIDGDFAGWWYEPGEDRKHRWHVSDFGIGEKFSAGKSSVEIRIEPPAGVALWSVSSIGLYALLRRG